MYISYCFLLQYNTANQGDLICYERGEAENVPGCFGEGIRGKGYCANRPPTFLLFKGDSPPFSDGALTLGLCEGDCDNDGECAGDLICYQRNGYTSVPGCNGEGRRGKDYCYDLNLGCNGEAGSGNDYCYDPNLSPLQPSTGLNPQVSCISSYSFCMSSTLTASKIHMKSASSFLHLIHQISAPSSPSMQRHARRMQQRQRLLHWI